MNDKKFIPFWMEKPKEEIIEAYIECIHNGEVLLKRIDKAIEYIENYCIGNLQYENKTHKVLLNILRGEDK